MPIGKTDAFPFEFSPCLPNCCSVRSYRPTCRRGSTIHPDDWNRTRHGGNWYMLYRKTFHSPPLCCVYRIAQCWDAHGNWLSKQVFFLQKIWRKLSVMKNCFFHCIFLEYVAFLYFYNCNQGLYIWNNQQDITRLFAL